MDNQLEMKKLLVFVAVMLFAVGVLAADNGAEEVNDGDDALFKHLEEDQLDLLGQKSRLVQPDEEAICTPCLPFLPMLQCCKRGFTYVDLRKDAYCDGINSAEGVQVLQQSPAQTTLTGDCNRRALLKVNFETFTKEPCNYCLRRPLCGRRMLKIDLELSSGERTGFGFNIGDSSTNDGYKGDYTTQENNAEMEGVFPLVRLYHSDKCISTGSFKTFPTAIGQNVSHVTIYVSNQHVRIVNDQGLDDYVCDNCFYALNGQADSYNINEDIYIGLNRVITGRSDRNGQGVCSATLTWVCPEL